MSDPVVYELKHPFTMKDGKEYKTLTFNRPKGKHIKKLGGNPKLEDLMGVAAKMSGVTPMVMDEMDAEDYMTISEIVGDFLGSGQETGD